MATTARNIVSTRLPGQSRARLRLPLLLLAALLMNVLVISLLTVQALRGQRAEIERSRLAAQERALASLSNEIEQALQNAVQTPFLLLKNIRQEDVGAARLELLRTTFPGVEQVLFLDQDARLKLSFPTATSRHQRLATDWIVERVEEEQQGIEHQPLALHSFVEELDGRPTLFAFEASNDLSASETTGRPDSWILLRFTLETLLARHAAPILRRFGRENDLRVQLLGPEDDAVGQTVVLNRVLPGWRLVSSPAQNAGRIPASDDQDWTIIAIGAGALVAVALAGVAIWWEIRREHALVDLRNRFVASVSHELKTPLSLIRMYAETLHLQRQPDEQRRNEYLSIMLREAERLSLMIDDVLSFTRLRSGGEIYHLIATDLVATVSAIVDQYRTHFAGRGLRLDLAIVAPVPAVAHDPHGVTQILLNLLDNAAKYAQAGGRADIRLSAENDWVDLTVIDHGAGINAAERARLTRTFRRGDMVDAAHGSGLGLALVEYVAEAHHAHFILDQADDHPGVKAVVSFPIYRGHT